MVPSTPHQPVYRRPLFDDPQLIAGYLHCVLYVTQADVHGEKLSPEASQSLHSLAQQQYDPLGISVFYGGHDDGSLHSSVLKISPNARFLSLHDALSPAQAFNLAFLYSIQEGAEFVYCMLPACRLADPYALKTIVSSLQKNKNIGIGMPMFCMSGEFFYGITDERFALRPLSAPSKHVKGFWLEAFLVRRALLDAGLRLREDFNGTLEGFAFGFEARRQGWEILCDTSATALVHSLAGVQRLQPANPASLYLLSRNHARVIMDHPGPLNPLKLFFLRRRYALASRRAGLPAMEARKALADGFRDARAGRMGPSPKWAKP